MNTRFFTLVLLLSTLFLSWCTSVQEESAKTQIDNRLEYLRTTLKDATDSTVLVVAHRADWRNAPENSIEAIRSAIELGVDIVELDVRLTKDSVLVLMHDKTINRTTSGKGLLNDWTYDSLRALYLRNGQGRVTEFKIPTLKEALIVAKGNILVNLDKCYEHFDLVVQELRSTSTLDHVIIKAYDKTYEEVRADLGSALDEVFFMPILRLENIQNISEEIETYQREASPVAFELTFQSDTFSILENLDRIKENGSRVWINSLWDDLNGGHSDNLALQDPDLAYGWIVKTGANIIQTDRPQLLIEYLRSKRLHK